MTQCDAMRCVDLYVSALHCDTMPVRAKRDETKVPMSLRIDRDLYEYLVKKRDTGRFYNLTHAVEEAIRALQKQEK